MDVLTDKQAKSVELAPPVSKNWTQASLGAGYSPKSARSWASRLKQNETILAAIRARNKRLAKLVEPSEEEIVAELQSIGFSRIDHYVEIEEDGTVLVKKLDEIPYAARSAIKSIKQKKTTFNAKKGQIPRL